MTTGDARRPTLALVTGRPGSGKTTLARRLARALDCPLVSRDEIHAGIRRTLEGAGEPASREHVLEAAFGAYFRVIGLLLSVDVTLVAEAAFQDERWRIGLEPLLPLAELRVIHCTVDPELAARRVAWRRLEAEANPSAPVAPGAGATAPRATLVRPFEPLSLSVPSLRVATAEDYAPPLDEIVAFVASR